MSRGKPSRRDGRLEPRKGCRFGAGAATIGLTPLVKGDHMITASQILALADSHFILHLLGPDEEDIAPVSDDAEESAAGKPAAEGDLASTVSAILPENLVEDFLDEMLGMFEEVTDLYSDQAGWERALVFGFVDGALAVADDTWSTYEDTYFADAKNPEFAVIDAAIDRIAADFEASRPWDEAVKGYVRTSVAQSDNDSASRDWDLWTACANGFFYGAEAAYDLEWKFVVTPAGNVMLTDEDAIGEAAFAQMTAESEAGGGSLIDRVFDMIGIDFGELADAISALDDGDDEGDGDDADGAVESVEAELIGVEDVSNVDAAK